MSKISETTIPEMLSRGELWVGERVATSSRHNTDSQNNPLLVAPFGIQEIDNTFVGGGLAFGKIHEWFLDTNQAVDTDLDAASSQIGSSQIASRKNDSSIIEKRNKQRNYSWIPPLLVLAQTIRNSLFLEQNKKNTSQHGNILQYSNISERRAIVWIGRRCWPTPSLLETITPSASILKNSPQQSTDRRLTDHQALTNQWNWHNNCVFLDPADKEERIWATAQLLRSPTVHTVISDGSGLSLLATRKLLLAADEGGTLGFILRPPWEETMPSAASTRWRIKPVGIAKPNDDLSLLPTTLCSWHLDLVRTKGARPVGLHSRALTSWDISWDEEENKLLLNNQVQTATPIHEEELEKQTNSASPLKRLA